MPYLNFNPQDFGLKFDHLYEIISTTYSIEESSEKINPNAACMGIRMLKNKEIAINPFPNTNTYINLKENSTIVINFVDNVYLYALASLKEPDSRIGVNEFPSKYYSYRDTKLRNNSLPYIKEAWGFLICEVTEHSQKIKESSIGKSIISEFILNVLISEKIRESVSLFNRADNLVLESIILATRIRIVKNEGDLNHYSKLLNQLNVNIKDIKRFGGNKKALKTINLVKKYVEIL